MSGMAAPNESLATAFQRCRQSFDTILKQLDAADGGELSKATWEDEASRLRLWGSNIGATSKANTSLDFRLRDADTVRQQIYKNLSNLDEALNEALKSMKDLAPSSFDVDGFPASNAKSATKANVADPPPRNESTSKDSSDNEDDLVEDAEASLEDLQAAFQDVVSLINSLFRMTLYIRNPSRRDQLKQRDTCAVANFETYDVSHVGNKFPNAEHTLSRRLGQANTVRRANLRYWERHHKKLAYDETVNDQATVAALSESVATTFKPVEVEEQHDTRSHFSGTSYMESLLGGESIRRPDLPDAGKNGLPFQCPICCYIITVSGQREWMKHVFFDLQPYVCVFEQCKTPLLLYENRRDWFAHVEKNHLPRSGPASLVHQIQCPLCKEHLRSRPLIRRHLARHLEEVALFSLPNSLFGEETEMVDDDKLGEYSSEEEPVEKNSEQMTGDSAEPPQRAQGAPSAEAEKSKLDDSNNDFDHEELEAESRILEVGEDPREEKYKRRRSSSDASIVLKPEDDPHEQKYIRKRRSSDVTIDFDAEDPRDDEYAKTRAAEEEAGAVHKVQALSSTFHTQWLPAATGFLAAPPSDLEVRIKEHSKLSYGITAQILLKADSIDTEGSVQARDTRKNLVREASKVLNQLDSVMKGSEAPPRVESSSTDTDTERRLDDSSSRYGDHLDDEEASDRPRRGAHPPSPDPKYSAIPSSNVVKGGSPVTSDEAFDTSERGASATETLPRTQSRSSYDELQQRAKDPKIPGDSQTGRILDGRTGEIHQEVPTRQRGGYVDEPIHRDIRTDRDEVSATRGDRIARGYHEVDYGQSHSTKYNDCFVPGTGIDRVVIQHEICRYLGNDATVRPFTHKDVCWN